MGFLFVLQAKYHVPNSAIDFLIKFLYILICVLSRFCFSPFVDMLWKSFPRSLHVMRKRFAGDFLFSKYPVCPKCSKVYDSYESCIETIGTIKSSKCCNHIEFPKHPHQSRRTACKALLMKTVHCVSGRKLLYPFKIYCYSGITSTLQKLLLRPSFFTSCQQWRSRPANNMLSDLYDGRIWKEFLNVAGSPFLAAPYTFGLMLNVDWFQPYTHTIASVGVIYLAIMNLPRTIRFKLENIIIVGIIPGPSEPHHDINQYLRPLVCELLQFWTGVKLQIYSSTGIIEKVVKCALLCVSCDLPAGRKACGFLSYTARLGCSRCMKEFPGSVGDKRNYSGFDRSKWTHRSDANHRQNVQKIMKCKSKAELTKAESKFGCRYSSLLDLQYFSPTRFLVIDPMHNMFLGTGKRILSLWIELQLLNSTHFDQIQQFVDNMVVPCDVGRIPSKIGSGFSGFKADQFKTWITLYSIPALKGILPDDHLECWRHFVLACRIFCKQSLSRTDIELADSLILQFCKRVERMYGEAVVTPNMHLHGHLKDVILDYGPVQEFWCFSFERYNGILGNQPTNNRAIEPQLLKQFLLDNFTSSYNFPNEFSEDFTSLDLNNFERSRVSGSVIDTISNEGFLLPPKCKRCVFDMADLEVLAKLYAKIHPNYSDITVNSVYRKYSSIVLNGKPYRSSGKHTHNSCKPYVVSASWNESYYGSPPTVLPRPDTLHPSSNERPVNVHYYITATVSFSTAQKHNICHQSWTVAHVSWFFPHPYRYNFGKPVELWCPTLFEAFGLHSYVPLDHLLTRCAHGPCSINDESLMVVVPLV